jgi:hypothetical protein
MGQTGFDLYNCPPPCPHGTVHRRARPRRKAVPSKRVNATIRLELLYILSQEVTLYVQGLWSPGGFHALG